MPRMDVMDAVVKVMEDEGVEVAFGVPGAAILPLYQALGKSGKIRHYSVRHEEGGNARRRRLHPGHGQGRDQQDQWSRRDQHDHRPLHLHG